MKMKARFESSSRASEWAASSECPQARMTTANWSQQRPVSLTCQERVWTSHSRSVGLEKFRECLGHKTRPDELAPYYHFSS
jgi:hypothetical protein